MAQDIKENSCTWIIKGTRGNTTGQAVVMWK